jgi:hypothetical protein
LDAVVSLLRVERGSVVAMLDRFAPAAGNRRDCCRVERM